MPFDGRDNTPALNRARLIEALRAEMPPCFEWNFGIGHKKTDCGTTGCAVGLAMEIGILPMKTLFTWREVANTLGMHELTARGIFMGAYFNCVMERVTPAMVADALEKLVA